jgi:hypothetical protein
LAETTEGETRLIQSYSATALTWCKSAATLSHSYVPGLGLDWDSLYAERRIGLAKRGVHHPDRARRLPGPGGVRRDCRTVWSRSALDKINVTRI